jgi:hypothetical protein
LAAVGAGAKAYKVSKDAGAARNAAADLTYTKAALQHANSRPYMQSKLLVKVIMSTKPVRDPGGMRGAAAWKAAGSFNGKRVAMN